MRELGGVPEEARGACDVTVSVDSLIQPHLEKNRPLQTVAADGKVPFRLRSLKLEAARDSLVIGTN
jgi:putative transposase